MNNQLGTDLPDDYEDRIRNTAVPEKEPSSLGRKAASFLLIAGGVTAVGLVIVPGRTAGASRTARLMWEHRQSEIAKATDQSAPSVQQP